MLYAATSCCVGGTTSLLPKTQSDSIEHSCMNVAVHLCRNLGLQFDLLEQILSLCCPKTQSTLFLFLKARHKVSLRQVGLCLTTLHFVFLFVGHTVGTIFHLQC
jgi:hypothetical protein